MYRGRVAEHFKGLDRKRIIKAHVDTLKNGGIAFISVPYAYCIPSRIYEFIMGFRRRNIIEYAPYSKAEFKCIVKECNIDNYYFIGSSYIETYNPLAFYRRKRGLIRNIPKIKKEKSSCFDKYLGREITFMGFKKDHS